MLKVLINGISDIFAKPVLTKISTCFVAGCGHSGTTLVAAKLGNSKECFLLGRETNNFSPVRGLYCAREVAYEWVSFAEGAKKKVLLEKTPKHIHSIERIRKIFPEARFILMVRNPLDNCASLFLRFGDLNFSIERWNIDNAKILRYLNDPGVKVVRYEDLTESPGIVLKQLADFVGMHWDESNLEAADNPYAKIEHEDTNMRLRAEQVGEQVRKNSGKWQLAFSDHQAEMVLNKTKWVAERLGYFREG
ncbi:MAG: sulfotransferase [Azonexus sp.]